MKKIFVFLPCYNEEKNIGPLIENWVAMADIFKTRGYSLLITCIDDKSTDSTAQIVQQYADCCKNVFLFKHKENKNLGGGVFSAFTLFNKHGAEGDLCVLMDGDNTHDPVYSESMLDKILGGADCVIASRYQQNAEVVGVPPIRLFLSEGAKWIYKLILNVKNVNDYTCGYRMYTYEIIDKAFKRYGKKTVEAKNFSCMMEVLYKLYCVGARFEEVPFTLRYDLKEGASKIKILKTVYESLTLALRLRITLKRSK